MKKNILITICTILFASYIIFVTNGKNTGKALVKDNYNSQTNKINRAVSPVSKLSTIKRDAVVKRKVNKLEIGKSETKKTNNSSFYELIEMMQDKRQDVRELAAIKLAQLGSGEAVEALIGLIKRSSGEEKKNLLKTIDMIDNAESLEPLIDELLEHDSADAELNRAIRKSLRKRNSPEIVQQLLSALHDTDNRQEETQVGLVLHGLKNNACTSALIDSALDENNKPYIQYVFGGLSSISSKKAIEGIFEIANKYPNDEYVNQEALKSFGFASNNQKLFYLKDVLLSNYNIETKRLALSAFKNDGTMKSTNIINQVLEQIDNPQLENDVLETLAELPEQTIR